MKRLREIAAGLSFAGCAFMSQAQAQTQALLVGFGTNKPPYVYEFEGRGLEFDLVAAALREAGDEMTPYYAPMERLHLMLKHGELDAITTTSKASGIRAFYSQSYIEYQNVAVSLARNQIAVQRIAGLDRYSVSAFQRARYLLGSEFTAMVARNPDYREEARQITRNLLLYAGRVEVVIADERIFKAFNPLVENQVDSLQPVTVHRLFPATPYSLGFIDSAARDRFNKGLAALRASGEYQRIMAGYAVP